MSIYIVKVREKLVSEERTVLDDVLGPPEAREATFRDMHRSENKEIGEPAMYALEISAEEARELEAAEPTNLEYIEEAGTVYPVGIEQMDVDPQAAPTMGVNEDALDFHGFLLDDENVGEGVAVCVVDSGLHAGYPWTDARLVERWNYTSQSTPDGYHGTWCCGAAVPDLAQLISAQVFAGGRGASMSNILASWHKFADWCDQRDLKGVVSNSLGGGSGCQMLATTDAAFYCQERGVAVVAASGNDSWRQAVSDPGGCRGVYSVGAVDRFASPVQQAYFSNSSDILPRVYAAGVREFGQGGTMSGTSMATPILARAVARALSVPGTRPGAAKKASGRTADGRRSFGGVGGVLDVPHMLRNLR